MNKKKLIWQLPFLAILVIGTIFIIRQQHVTPYQHDEGFIFGTIYHITYQSDENYQKEIEEELQKVDQSLSYGRYSKWSYSTSHPQAHYHCKPQYFRKQEGA